MWWTIWNHISVLKPYTMWQCDSPVTGRIPSMPLALFKPKMTPWRKRPPLTRAGVSLHHSPLWIVGWEWSPVTTSTSHSKINSSNWDLNTHAHRRRPAPWTQWLREGGHLPGLQEEWERERVSGWACELTAWWGRAAVGWAGSHTGHIRRALRNAAHLLLCSLADLSQDEPQRPRQ